MGSAGGDGFRSKIQLLSYHPGAGNTLPARVVEVAGELVEHAPSVARVITFSGNVKSSALTQDLFQRSNVNSSNTTKP